MIPLQFEDLSRMHNQYLYIIYSFHTVYKTFREEYAVLFFSSSLYMYFDNRKSPLHYIFGNISLKNSIIFRLKIVFKVIVIWVIINCV